MAVRIVSRLCCHYPGWNKAPGARLLYHTYNTSTISHSYCQRSGPLLTKNTDHHIKICSPHIQTLHEYSSEAGGDTNSVVKIKSTTVVGTPTSPTTWTNPYSEDTISEHDPIVHKLFQGLVQGDRASLAKSITLVETVHPKKKAQAQILLTKVLQYNKNMVKHSMKKNVSFRIGEYHNKLYTMFLCIINVDAVSAKMKEI